MKTSYIEKAAKWCVLVHRKGCFMLYQCVSAYLYLAKWGEGRIFEYSADFPDILAI